MIKEIIAIHKNHILSANAKTFNHHVVTQKKNAIKMETRLKFAGIKIEHPCELIVGVCNLTGGKFDPPNTYPTIKAMVDEIVNCGCLPDDNSKVIEAMTFHRLPRRQDCQKGYYYFSLCFIPTRELKRKET